MRKDQGIWNSFTTVPNTTDLILTTDRRLLAVIVGCRTVEFSDIDCLNLVCVDMFLNGTRQYHIKKRN